MSGLSGLGWVQVHSTSFSFSLDQQLITLMCSLGERRDHKRTKPTLQAHFKPLIVSCLLTYHWLIQVTLLSPKSKGRGTLSSHCEAVTRTWMCDATTEQCKQINDQSYHRVYHRVLALLELLATYSWVSPCTSSCLNLFMKSEEVELHQQFPVQYTS